MATYLELLAEKRALDARIDALRAEAADETLAAARAAIAEFGFTPDDLFGKPRAKREKKGAARSRKNASAQDADHGNLDLFGGSGAN
ncbi:DNA-binding protein H-NS [Paraburkholderia tropica]|uniref:H-NS family nucleoid-associated regulatory protein n=1 Tax=Paraburkholderia tropica TaxID=92647 RepID=UPI0016153810|nr:H-NS family nucleoid-associated regulatory protein [Paraburkholderia tropica]MBB3002139.1 DNA-binding protein H-NS [Paraburkholderia tropica]MBB6321522.1 DNA-binding protein H-NS [Paraburkholderia tropica]